MELSVEDRRRVETITGGMECPKGFECYKSGFEKPPKVRKVADGKVLECLEEAPKTCRFRVDFGSGGFCECPVLNFAVQELNIQ
jgi:hypothetical protein